jgi:D-alanyl-lipoteichoic acid acyltransferase DltB (MBOAT superfamily)
MLFHSLVFWKFFAVVFAAYFFVPHKAKWLFLLLASYFFYGFWKIDYLLLLAIPTLATYLAARAMAAARKPAWRKGLLWAGLTVTLGLLFVFKYLDLFRQAVLDLKAYLGLAAGPRTALRIILPIGISFFTFRMVSYLIDVYHQRIRAERHLGLYALYVAFFPQLLAGPIDRAARLLPQFRQPVSFDWERIGAGARLAAWGLFKKIVIADRLSFFVNHVFQHPDGQGLNVVFAAYFFAFQIYCDFSGYSDIAVGISRMLGFESMKNFDFPYYSRSISEFWSRWHISLSSWLRDYLFLPLAYAVMRRIPGERRLAVKAETWGYVVGTMLTMLLGGLWHGAGWTFVAWGGLYGLYQVVAYASKRPRRRWLKKIGWLRFPRLDSAWKVFATFNLVSFAWIFFRAASFRQAWRFIGQAGLHFPEGGGLHLLFNSALLAFFLVLEFFSKNMERIVFWQRWPRPLKMAGFALFCCLLIVLAVDKSNEFIYFQF